MKKCSRCNVLLNWNKPYCPMCGGHTVEVAEPAKPAASPISAPAPLAAVPEVKEESPALEPLDSLAMPEGAFGIQKGSGDKMTLTPPEPETGAANMFERFDAPQEILPTAPDATAAMFERRDGEAFLPTAPTPTASVSGVSGEFLKMFPDAKPD